MRVLASIAPRTERQSLTRASTATASTSTLKVGCLDTTSRSAARVPVGCRRIQSRVTRSMAAESRVFRHKGIDPGRWRLHALALVRQAEVGDVGADGLMAMSRWPSTQANSASIGHVAVGTHSRTSPYVESGGVLDNFPIFLNTLVLV